MSGEHLELLKFPTPYPIKVVCRRRENLRLTIDALVRRHTPDLAAEAIQERDSKAGHFVSITYQLTARSAAHITALLAELQAHDAVIMVI